MNRKTKLILIVSLILNVALLGILLGQSPRRFDRGARWGQRVDQALKDLPETSQARLRQRYQQLRATAEPLFGQLRQAQDDAVGVLAAQSFNEAEFDRRQSAISELRGQISKKLSDVVKKSIQDLSPEERQRFAELLRRPPLAPAKS